VLNTKNTWGRKNGPDAQRSDLWMMRIGESPLGVSTRGPLNTLSEAIQSRFPERYALFDNNEDFALYPSLVSFPETAIGRLAYMQGNAHVAMPAEEAEVNGVRITFRVNVPKRAGLPAAVNLLQSWRDLARIGRGMSVGGRDLPDLITATDQPPFRFDVSVIFLAGADRVAVAKSFDNTSATNAPLPMRNSFAAVLRKTWCSSVQLGPDISYTDGNRTLDIVAQVYPEYIDFRPVTDADYEQSGVSYVALV